MKIERKNKVVAFGDIKEKIGTCFAYADMAVFMILPSCYSNNKKIVALNLENNHLIFDGVFSDDDLVAILNLKLVEE